MTQPFLRPVMQSAPRSTPSSVPAQVAFVGAGGIAQSHAFALAALPYYYPDVARVARLVVASPRAESRRQFAERFDFTHALAPDALWKRDDIDTIFILGPNTSHATQFEQALAMPSVRRIYLEKPVCSTQTEALRLAHLSKMASGRVQIQAGFQFLQMPAMRRAIGLWRQAALGTPIHFQARYLHSGYLQPGYRAMRGARLLPMPAGGAMADLGSHALSLLVALLGSELEVIGAQASGNFPDVPRDSDLCTMALLRDRLSGAVGSVTASRISAGAGDVLELEMRGAQGALRLSTERPDVLEFSSDAGQWQTQHCGSDYLPVSKFPSLHAPSGWLRSLIHAHYLFLGGADAHAAVPDLQHGLAVQRLLFAVVERLAGTR